VERVELAQLIRRHRFKPRKHRIDVLKRKLIDRCHPRLDIVVLDVRHDQANRRIDARIEWHDHAGHTEVARHAAGVHWTGAAKRQQHEIAQVVPAHGGDRLDRLLHLHVDDAHDAFGGFLNAHAQRLGDLALDRTPGFLGVEAHAAAEEVFSREMPHHEVAVGDGRHVAAAAVAGRSWHGAVPN